MIDILSLKFGRDAVEIVIAGALYLDAYNN